jgi:HEAT repeat protein
VFILIADMLNDDEYSVRLASIEALRDIFQKHAPQLKMNSEQLQQVQLAVDDPNSDYRKHCFHLFG